MSSRDEKKNSPNSRRATHYLVLVVRINSVFENFDMTKLEYLIDINQFHNDFFSKSYVIVYENLSFSFGRKTGEGNHRLGFREGGKRILLSSPEGSKGHHLRLVAFRWSAQRERTA